MSEDRKLIAEWMAGKNIFITGGTGFLGKVMIEKILRSCPDVENVYILIRQKKNKSATERVQEIFNLPLFDLLRENHPEYLKKVIPIIGCASQLGLGISPEDRALLIEKMNIVYHGAASVRFDDHLTDAILLNTRGTREVVNLALEAKHLEVFVHISTTYCQIDKPVIDEKVYPALMDWRQAITIAEEMDRNTLDIYTAKFINPLINTYTFTKALSERVVNDLCNGKVPAVILRPSIVIPTETEPVSGWVDNFNGPIALMIAYGKGILRTAYVLPDQMPDYIPADHVVKSIILASYAQTISDELNRNELKVYNSSNNGISVFTNRDFCVFAINLLKDLPLRNCLWKPQVTLTECKLYFYFIFYVYQLLPSMLVDAVLYLTNNKPMLVKIQRKILIAHLALDHFMTHDWSFLNKKSVSLLDYKIKDFQVDLDNIDSRHIFTNHLLGARKYLLKEGLESLEQDKKHSSRMWIISVIFNTIWYLGLAYLLIFKIGILDIIYRKIDNYVSFITN